MAIQVRRGLEKDFDPEKALPGEWLLSTDTRYIRMCITPGVVLRMATYEAFESDMAKIQAVLTECKDIQSAINSIQAIVASKAALTVEYANSAAEYAKAAAASEANAKTYAENASAVAGVGIATQDTAGLMKGGENYVDESGALVLTKTTTDTTLPNSHAGGIKLIGMYGASVQESTTGKNQLDCRGLVEKTSYGVKFTPVYDEFGNLLYVEANGAATDKNAVFGVPVTLKAGTYIANGVNGGSTTSYRIQGQTTDDWATVISYTYNGDKTFTLDTEREVEYRMVIVAGYTANAVRFYPMIRLADIADATYEPYTGNAPSPSIDYPQEIKKSVVSEIWGHGKNFFEPKMANATSNNITCTNNGDGSFTLNGISATDTTFRIDQETRNGITNLKSYSGTYRISIRDSVGNENPQNVSLNLIQYPSYKHYLSSILFNTASIEADNCFMYIHIPANTTLNNLTVYPPVDEGTEATEYEPYQSFSHTLSQPIELNGLNGVTDVLTPSEVERNMVKYIPTATAIANMGFSGTGRFAWFSPSSLLQPISASDKMCISTHFTETESDNIVNAKVDYGVYLDTGINIRIKGFTTLDEYKDYFTSNEVEFYYVAATPAFESLPVSDQIALNSLKTYDGTTYIYCDCGEVKPTMKLKYGTSEVGALALENHCRENIHEIRLNELTTAMLVMNQE